MNAKPEHTGKLILVLGMHRSGTSATTRILNLLGVDLGGNFLPVAADNPQGYWEHAGAVAIHEKLLRDLGRSWDDTRALPDGWEASAPAHKAKREIAALIRRDFPGSSLWAVKDPRLCRLAPLWIDVAADLGIETCALFVVRHPDEVANSLHARDGLPPAVAELSWAEHFAEAEYATRALPRSLVLYNAILADWRAALSNVASDLALQWPKDITIAGSAVDGFLNKQHKHHNATNFGPKPSLRLPHQLYACCETSSRVRDGWASISALVDAYRQTAPTFLGDIARRADELQVATEQLRAAEKSAQDMVATIADRDQSMRDYERKVFGLLETVHGKDLQIQNRDGIIRGKDAEIQRRDETVRTRDKQIDGLAQSLAEQQRQALDLMNQLGAMAARGDALATSLEERSSRLAAMESSRSWRITRPMRAFKAALTGWWATSSTKSSGPSRVPANLVTPMTAGLDPQTSRPQTSAPSQVLDVVSPLSSSTAQAEPPTPVPPQEANFELRGAKRSIVILTTPHCMYVAKLIESALARAGLTSRIIHGMPEGGYDDVPHFVVCPQMFESLPGLYVSFQMEQSISSRWFTDEYIHRLENSFAILDYSLVNIAKLEQLGLYPKQVYYTPIDYLAKFVQAGSSAEPEYDVLFYGDDKNERRQRFLTELGKVCKVKVHNSLFGDDLYAEMAKAKVVVNIHYYAGALLETTRLWECLSLGKLVVSERSSDMEEQTDLEGLVDFVDVDDVAGLVNRVHYWLDHDGERQQRVAQVRESLQNRFNRFDYHFYRFLLATDNITFDQFWELIGSRVKLAGDKLCLNLPEWRIRTNEFDKDNRYGFVRFTGLRHSKGWLGCAMSYKLMIMLARQQGLPRVTICEDDVEFLPDFESRWKSIWRHLTNTTSGWDVFSGLMADLHKDARILDSSVDEDIQYVVTDKFISTVFNVYDAGVYDAIAAWDERNHDVNANTIDRYMESTASIRVMTTHPFLVGHKEEMKSTLWGFQNSQYTGLIAASNERLQAMLGSSGHSIVSVD